MPTSLPLPTDEVCRATAFTVRQHNKINNMDLDNMLLVTFTQETLSGITVESTGRRETKYPSTDRASCEARYRRSG